MEKRNDTRTLARSDETDEESQLKSELRELQEQLSRRKDELAGIEVEWSEFRALYMKTVGACYAELEAVERLITELQAATGGVEEDASVPDEAADEEEAPPPRDESAFQPLRQMRKLFWRVAKMFHPDLTNDEAERRRRHTLMAEANQAYSEGDAERLTSLLEYEDTLNVEAHDAFEHERFVMLRTEIAQTRRELRRIEEEIKRITEADFYYLKTKTDEAAQSGRDLLSEMAARVSEQVTNARRRLEELQ